MSTLSEQGRSQAKAKLARMIKPTAGKVDASDFSPAPDMANGVQTGPRPISRRAFKRGGKILGEVLKARSDRKPRASGGRAFADAYINRDVKEANEEREGTKHVGGFKRGGRAHKTMGGLALPNWADAVSRNAGGRTGKMVGGPMMGRPIMTTPRPMPTVEPDPRIGHRPMMRKDGGKIAHGADCKCSMCHGGTAKAKGGSVSYGGTRPTGDRMARKSGGRAKKGMNVNIIIAPNPPQGAAPPMRPPMPPPGAPIGLHQGPPPAAPAPMGPPAGAMPSPMMRKRGGRAYPLESGAGGGLGRLEKIKAYG
jgi:hypothetical protein